ncbi:hydrogenase maturation protease [Sporomusaceae bacterium BoRhaA]|uniref:HyaD/HybD family hydrogenase maturation endopeptidase n=1 Tax=Pelorhabdus rhamnosifermentans TaxID=2772457 RepID=UPI001C05F311|nr:HyaD/HybD family hydrogenase maturation endopeptidase [Pelorhabdus rhamnosifermentans]MBU2702373.1 hydrogenase maturation protease [Pelorhabdus rhamnosifermentans]
MAATITVLGIGNILLQDEGFGVRIIEKLHRRYQFSDAVQVLDGGTLGMDLLRFITGTTKLLVVDAISGGRPPGTFYRFAGNEVKAYFRDKVSLHELGIKDVLAVLEVLGEPIAEVVVIGVEAATAVFEPGLELTPIVAGMVDKTVTAVIAQLKEWQVELVERDSCYSPMSNVMGVADETDTD